MIVFLKGDAQHLEELEKVSGLLEKAGVTVKMEKYRLFSREVDYLGQTILPGKLAAAV